MRKKKMEEGEDSRSFRARAERTFGSLTNSSTVNLSSSLWRLTEDEEDHRPIPDPPPPPPTATRHLGPPDIEQDFSLLLRDTDSDEEEEDGANPNRKPDGIGDEEWEIKSSIGLDSTLDCEDEEDESDRVAAGKIKAEDRLYMKGVSDYGIYMDSLDELPSTFGDITKDPRANHMAAKLRIREDAEAARQMDGLQVTDKHLPDEDGTPKSIMKRKDDELDSKQQNCQLDFRPLKKRVRFDSECKDDNSDCSTNVDNSVMETDSAEALAYPVPTDYPSGIPDYMRNPSGYTLYTFDSSSEMDEESNRQACLDFLNMIKRSKGEEIDDAPVDLPKSLTFVPRRKSNNSMMDCDLTNSKLSRDDRSDESFKRRGILVGFAPVDEDDTDTCAMEEDEPKMESDRRNKAPVVARQYRTKPVLEMDESV